MRKKTIDQVRQEMLNHGHTLLSDEYICGRSKLTVKCPSEHIYQICWSDFNNGRRCKFCKGAKNSAKRTTSFDIVKREVELRKYTLVSSEYIPKTKLQMKCPLGHDVVISLDDFKSGRGCVECKKTKIADFFRLDYETVREVIENEKYTLLSQDYKNAHTNLTIQCRMHGHIQTMSYSNFQKGQRCKKCTYKSRQVLHSFEWLPKVKGTIEAIDGYELLSSEYINSTSKLEIKCKLGHVFHMTYSNFTKQRCPMCKYIHNWKNNTRYKKYCLPSGKEVTYQGYENYALDNLLKQYNEDDLLIHPNIIIPYEMEGKSRKHYPDIYIPDKNLIIEVKSTWTYQRRLEENQLKQEASKSLGYAYEFWIFGQDGNGLTVIA